MEKNVLGGELAACSDTLSTGFTRSGCCETHPGDRGRHEICAVMTQEFLEYSRERGNDLVTPRPELEFPGLHPGDRWCVCVPRWKEALDDGVAPPVVLEATNAAVLDEIPLETLEAHSYNGERGQG
ncbi:MAG: DUF2237 family protein [Halobacteriales archaeon]